jgi:hypothetical protein
MEYTIEWRCVALCRDKVLPEGWVPIRAYHAAAKEEEEDCQFEKKSSRKAFHIGGYITSNIAS